MLLRLAMHNTYLVIFWISEEEFLISVKVFWTSMIFLRYFFIKKETWISIVLRISKIISVIQNNSSFLDIKNNYFRSYPKKNYFGYVKFGLPFCKRQHGIAC